MTVEEYAALDNIFRIGANVGWFLIGIQIGKMINQRNQKDA